AEDAEFPRPVRQRAARTGTILGLLLLATCSDEGSDCQVPLDEQEAPKSKAGYFPLEFTRSGITCNFGSRKCLPTLSGFEIDWYSAQLEAAKEPSLYLASRAARPTDALAVRFTWLRSFHPPVVVRIEGARSKGFQLVAKELSGPGGYEPGQVARTVNRQLTAAEAARLHEMLARSRLFSLPAKDCLMGCDGASWVFEGVDSDGYHFVDRWTPEEGRVKELGMFFLGLSGWRFTDVY
ncbi:MAG TPA: hypothetical protein VGR19_01175, partial [Allosphingosinicella sp.]|nr:hypothetical protein [Allosphingosinicella sp.]